MKAVLITKRFSPLDQCGKYYILGWLMMGTRAEVEVCMCRCVVYLTAKRSSRSLVNTYLCLEGEDGLSLSNSELNVLVDTVQVVKQVSACLPS